MNTENVKLDSFWKSFVQKVQQNKKLLWAMAAFWLVIALALCAVYFAVDGATINGTANPGPTSPSPGGASTTTTTTDPSTSNKTIASPIIGPIILPGMTNITGSPTGSTQPSTVNGTTTPPQQNATKIPPTTSPPITGTQPPTNVTMFPTSTTNPSTNGTMPSTTGTQTPPTETASLSTETTPPSTETTSSSTETTSPPTETTPPPSETTPPTSVISPPVSPGNPQPPVPMSPTAWIYPGLFWPPVRQPSYSSSVDSFDQSMSDQSGDVLIEDFKETITIHKKTIRKHRDKFEKENSDVSSSSEIGFD